MAKKKVVARLIAPTPKPAKPIDLILQIRSQPNYDPPCAAVWFLKRDGAARSMISWGEVLIDHVAGLLAWAKDKGVDVEHYTDETTGEPQELLAVPVEHQGAGDGQQLESAGR